MHRYQLQFVAIYCIHCYALANNRLRRLSKTKFRYKKSQLCTRRWC